MKSIIQQNEGCYFCGNPAVDVHHCFGGANRKHSEEYGLTIKLCRYHHEQIHRDQVADEALKRMAQGVFESKYSHEKFMQIFKKNYR